MLELGLVGKSREASFSQKEKQMRVISVTSGKGGVGKSSIVANLALSFAAQGRKVLLLDGDFGLANLDIMLDLKPRYTIHDVLRGDKTVKDLLVSVSSHVDVLPSASGVLDVGSLGIEDKTKILDVINDIQKNYDLLLIDTGAGIGDDVTWLNSTAGDIVVVLTPEPTSMADAYALIKVLNQKHKIKDFKVLVNQSKNEQEGLRVYQQITAVADKFLNVSIDYVGSVFWDEMWTHAIRQRRPLVSAFPDSNTAKNFQRVADTIERASGRRIASSENYFRTLLGHA